jgi:hypothetical protein
LAETFTVFVDPQFNADERTSIGSAIVDYVVKRTRAGRGVGNRPFLNAEGKREYSKSYQDTREFAIGGKGSRPINLTLTGDMLFSIEVLDISLAGRIIIGIEDEENSQKAVWMREKGYHFLGISDDEKSLVLSKFQKLSQSEILRRVNNG